MTPLAYALLAVAASGDAVVGPPVAQVTIQRRVIIRVPALADAPPPPVPVPRAIRWTEKRGPKCLVIAQLAGAAITRADSVDLVLRGGRRLRAQLDDGCPALDYYSGFYLSPTRDGMVCGGRDMIHTRAGGQCAIERFRELVPRRERPR